MPVLKYRSVEQMPPLAWCESMNSECIERIRKLWRRSALFKRSGRPSGVIKYRNIEEAQSDRDRWSMERVFHKPR